ncbi:MAG: hypothetical protein LC650_00485 [Actinobacteria bacterium]|nr:hypothetical protein [Actinomycetota bacterium]
MKSGVGDAILYTTIFLLVLGAIVLATFSKSHSDNERRENLQECLEFGNPTEWCLEVFAE